MLNFSPQKCKPWKCKSTNAMIFFVPISAIQHTFFFQRHNSLFYFHALDFSFTLVHNRLLFVLSAQWELKQVIKGTWLNLIHSVSYWQNSIFHTGRSKEFKQSAEQGSGLNRNFHYIPVFHGQLQLLPVSLLFVLSL